ncbi:hypothetical protein OsI_17891 [Oryza sativa Indica Group]|uniref:Uncharacterized protein n=2 Tax=Oryza sativa TaxID=4530 RepID=A2XYW0_ORYSI|nr:hypothetical protein OsI_17891 [Oryza sativa Indica Group]CAJ86076.1 H0403D02.11 [Oryza sativa]
MPTTVCSRVWRRGRKRPAAVWAQRWRRDPRERRGLRPARREDSGIGPCAATARCSAAMTAVPPQIRASRPDLEGGRLWWSATAVDLRQLVTAVGNGGDGWLRQLAAATSADDAGGGLGGGVAEGNSEAAASSGGGSRRRWLVVATAVTRGMAALDG